MDKYEKIRVVGRGAYGTVYLCRRRSDQKLVIIKQIPVEQMTGEERQVAVNESKVLSMLDHPNIIKYYENFLEDKALSIVMEYAEGGTLFDYLQHRGNALLEEGEVLRLFCQLLLSLQHVHSKQILHRDLKTQNILLNKRRDVLKIADFGISKILSSKSKAFTVVGTPCYISPELCEGKPYNQKSDIWAVGCVLYELLTFKRAFEADNLPALVMKIMRGSVAPISDRYSDELKRLLLQMLHLDPSKRPTINEVIAEPIIIKMMGNVAMEMGQVKCPLKIQSSYRVRGNTKSTSQKGWMNTDVMREWAEKCFAGRPGAFFDKTSMLVLDSMKSHKDEDIRKLFKSQHDTILGVIPGGLTKKLQPLDITVNWVFKLHIRKAWEEWMAEGLHTYTKTGRMRRANARRGVQLGFGRLESHQASNHHQRLHQGQDCQWAGGRRVRHRRLSAAGRRLGCSLPQ